MMPMKENILYFEKDTVSISANMFLITTTMNTMYVIITGYRMVGATTFSNS